VDRVTVNEAYELELGARDRMIADLRACEVAIEKMDAGTWGECETCGNAISEKRLRAIPETPYCLPCREKIDQADRYRRFDHRPPRYEEDE
jgi:DnaK suppressor protein